MHPAAPYLKIPHNLEKPLPGNPSNPAYPDTKAPGGTPNRAAGCTLFDECPDCEGHWTLAGGIDGDGHGFWCEDVFVVIQPCEVHSRGPV